MTPHHADEPSPPMSAMPGRIWVLAGPTAGGKTSVALELAGLLPELARAALPAATHADRESATAALPVTAEIISADARQIFHGMRIGTAQPTAAERARCPHHLVDCVDPLNLYTAAQYGRDARRVLADLAARQAAPLVVGGSGLYVQALIEGLFTGPGQDPELRAALNRRAETEVDAALHAELGELDPETAARLHPNDRVRVIRALEVACKTGMPISEHHRRQSAADSLAARTHYVVLDRDRDELHARIQARTTAMFTDGILDEAQALLARGLTPEHPTYRTVGYREAFAVIRGEMDVAAAIAATQAATRHYARRQLIWFRAVERATWVRAAPRESPAATARRIADTLTAADRRNGLHGA
jgi:tRNA dimethylallyltransferase